MNPPSSCGAFTLLLPVISVDGCGVGGKLGRGIIVRAVLIEDVLAGVQLLQKEKNWRREGKEIGSTIGAQHYHGQGVAWALVTVEEVEHTRAGSQRCDWPISHLSLDCASSKSANDGSVGAANTRLAQAFEGLNGWASIADSDLRDSCHLPVPIR